MIRNPETVSRIPYSNSEFCGAVPGKSAALTSLCQGARTSTCWPEQGSVFCAMKKVPEFLTESPIPLKIRNIA